MIIKNVEIKYDGKLVFQRLVMSAQYQRIPKLFSQEEACFLFLTKGAFLFRTPTNLLTFSEGDAMLAKCGNYFMENISLNKTELQTISVLGAFFYPDVVKGLFQNGLSIESFTPHPDVAKIDIEPLMKSFIDSLNFMLDNPPLVDDNLILTKLRELLILLSKSENATSTSEFVHSLFVKHEYNFREIIQRNIYSNLSLDELAFLCNMSLATFKRKFTETFQESPARYFQAKKLEQAKHLLSIKSKSISEIAFECGFESITTFNKVFRKELNQSPTEYRHEPNGK